ncbi:MAG: tail fiber protein [Pseudomonadota bacterium]
MKSAYSAVAGAMALLFGMAGALPGAAQAQERYLGEIFVVGENFCPRGSAALDGQILQINANQSLYSLLGTTFGGDGRTTFALPDLRARSPLGAGSGTNLTATPLGQKGGATGIGLTAAHMPPHTHAPAGTVTGRALGTTASAAQSDPSGVSPAATGGAVYGGTVNAPMAEGSVIVPLNGTNTAAAGGGNALNLYDPYLALRYCMATTGLFPSRN